ncbi:MAG: DNA-3-methyladenine glycosylase 2 family protein [Ruminococcaceae bacterium]|nr:DNA-3-methyladenine glycosylase 2 family protein [Oscillospiraceae bacterium]
MLVCNENELAHLRAQDERMAWAIDRIGPICRETEDDIFASIVSQIVGQQISGAAQRTVLSRLHAAAGEINADAIAALGADGLRGCGMSMRKAENILALAESVRDGSFDPDALLSMPDDEVVRTLTKLRGIGVWTAEMLLIFTLRRPDVLSFGDFGIRRGIRMLYGEKALTRARFEEYRRRFSPCGTAASLYLWAISGGALPELADTEDEA